jgi:Thrombospondin type 3 repeat
VGHAISPEPCDPERVWRIGLLIVVGCGFRPLAGDGLRDGAAVVDALDGPPGDVDGDGVADGDDNCPEVANPMQENEDGDDRGNACDLCPHLPGTVPGTDDDDDGDGIGNQCDPRPTMIDKLVVFLAFDDPHDLDAFALRAGTNLWTVSGGQLHQTDPAVAIPQQIVWTGQSIAGDVAVQTQLHIDAVPSGTGTRLAAVSGAYDDSGSVDAYACGVRSPDAGQTASSTGWHFSAPPAFDAQAIGASVGGTMTPGLHARESLVATRQMDNSTLDCRADAVPVQVAVTGFYPAGYPGFRTLGVTASFDYLFVVAIGP